MAPACGGTLVCIGGSRSSVALPARPRPGQSKACAGWSWRCPYNTTQMELPVRRGTRGVDVSLLYFTPVAWRGRSPASLVWRSGYADSLAGARIPHAWTIRGVESGNTRVLPTSMGKILIAPPPCTVDATKCQMWLVKARPSQMQEPHHTGFQEARRTAIQTLLSGRGVSLLCWLPTPTSYLIRGQRAH